MVYMKAAFKNWRCSNTTTDRYRCINLLEIILSTNLARVAWLVGDHLVLRDFGPHGVTFMHWCVVLSVAKVTLVLNFVPFEISS
jgi:hypothetical protein